MTEDFHVGAVGAFFGWRRAISVDSCCFCDMKSLTF